MQICSVQIPLLSFFSSATDCDLPEAPLHGRIDASNGTTVGHQIWYFCHDGYVLFGVEFRTCQPDGKWIPQVPVCKRESLAATSTVSSK